MISSARKKNKTKQKSQFITKPSTGKLKQWLPNSALTLLKNYLSCTRKRVPQIQQRQLFFLDKAALPGMRGTLTIQVDGQMTFVNPKD